MKESDVISLYGQLIERIKHEGNLFWLRYSAFFSIVSLLLIVWRYSLSKSPETFLGDPKVSLFFMSSGLAASFAWLLVALDGARWQEYFGEHLREMEMDNPFLPKIYTSLSGGKLIPDVVAIALSVTFLTFLGWMVAILLTNKLYAVIGLSVCLALLVVARIFQKTMNIAYCKSNQNKRAEGSKCHNKLIQAAAEASAD